MQRSFSVFLWVIFAVNFQAQGQTQMLAPGQMYHGKELLNERPTGQRCMVTIQSVQPLDSKGLHCFESMISVMSSQKNVPTIALRFESRITNYNRPDYPKLRSCAVNLDGSNLGPEIYGTDTALLFNDMFDGEGKVGRLDYDWFMTLNPATKKASEVRIHIKGFLTEQDVDCIQLQQM